MNPKHSTVQPWLHSHWESYHCTPLWFLQILVFQCTWFTRILECGIEVERGPISLAGIPETSARCCCHTSPNLASSGKQFCHCHYCLVNHGVCGILAGVMEFVHGCEILHGEEDCNTGSCLGEESGSAYVVILVIWWCSKDQIKLFLSFFLSFTYLFVFTHFEV